MTAADIDRAIKLVTDSPKTALSTPVWNMLLGMIGREGRLELMWKTFNDVSDDVLLPRAGSDEIDEETRLQADF
jgi:pentatricopeptide repeat protein